MEDTPDLGSGAKACGFDSHHGHWGVAQQVAQFALNETVGGSSPSAPASGYNQ